ncbi:hypothetical protein GJ744_011805 [Endocarpon pusillum]|uniref:Uncharacterized protein n=1 Tax=Endocarpon pusillum TaxID=364733 RepID=A0A8H7AE10_9EURO|nr:hypothetical protein GJ744_011805 [Endocarpon pusillum]
MRANEDLKWLLILSQLDPVSWVPLGIVSYRGLRARNAGINRGRKSIKPLLRPTRRRNTCFNVKGVVTTGNYW